MLETNIHYPTESWLIRDGLRKMLEMCSRLAADNNTLDGWRQHEHLWEKVKQLDRRINRIAAKKGPNYVGRMKPIHSKLLQKAAIITQRAREFRISLCLPKATADDIFGPNTLQAFIARTERVMDTATRRMIKCEFVPHSDKRFSVFEPHTQLYKRGKAGKPMPFGRQIFPCREAI